MCPAFRPIYFDESSNQAEDCRIGIAGCMASAYQWRLFEARWQAVLNAASVQPGDFHAVRTSAKTRGLNTALAQILMDTGIMSTCVTARIGDFEQATTPDERARYGGPYGFLRYASILALNLAFDDAGDSGHYAYYFDQGGQGGEWFRQLLQRIAANDELRAKYRLAGYGVVDRRVHLQVHAPDLIAHEVITGRHTSETLRIVGARVMIDDWSADQIREAMEDFRSIHETLNALKRDHRAKVRLERKQERISS